MLFIDIDIEYLVIWMYCLLRFVSTSIIGGQCRSVWDCGDLAAAWISNTLAGKDKGLRLVYHYSEHSQRTHSPKVHFHIFNGFEFLERKITISHFSTWHHLVPPWQSTIYQHWVMPHLTTWSPKLQLTIWIRGFLT